MEAQHLLHVRDRHVRPRSTYVHVSVRAEAVQSVRWHRLRRAGGGHVHVHAAGDDWCDGVSGRGVLRVDLHHGVACGRAGPVLRRPLDVDEAL